MRRNFLRFGKRNGGPNSNIGLQEDYLNEDFEDVEAPVSVTNTFSLSMNASKPEVMSF